jgi:hypothetical protein
MRNDATCIFIVPSFAWQEKFRLSALGERPDCARFLTRSGESVFLRSVILPPEEQRSIIEGVGLSVGPPDHIDVSELPMIKSGKISEFLSESDALLDIYRARKIDAAVGAFADGDGADRAR